ncbi:duf431 domain containing protein [Grosmannia clavigera kw1407]|uniref:Duf431 domain containing protein n=1 Tax=Grosmannia clavigera (strain kw1407 / UAMH 11150) TaxID=655863 RepID=F0XGT1_GROCL|nr:duf431 domain containing protein [Grosmannia clavigera kw1407]EFX03149.1 duf431 domain containing protein [Grosmannia clavigera kw1407]
MSKTYVVEHLDEGMGAWSTLEYVTIARETGALCLSSLPPSLMLPAELTAVAGFRAEQRSVEELYGGDAAQKARVCLLDPAAAQELVPADGDVFDVFLFGGILGDDPPRDRTSELRKKGFQGRRLGPKQMTTDTAVRVTRIVTEQKVPLDQISYVDFPELRFDEHESALMPFRYVKGDDDKPIMPEGMPELIKKDADNAIDDLF